MKFFAFAVVFWSILISHAVLGLDEKSVKEKQHCLRNPLTPAVLAQNVNLKWAMKAEHWYFSHFSKLELYRLASEVKQTPISEIQEDELYSDACLMMKWGHGVSPLVGFNGKTTLFNLTPIDKNVFTFKAPYSKTDGTAYVTLTDNKTFMFFSTCWGDDEASWAVITTTETLDEKTVIEIWEHAKSLGFDEKHFTQISFETCKDDVFGGKDEL